MSTHSGNWVSGRFPIYARVAVLTALITSAVAFNTSTVDTFGIVKITGAGAAVMLSIAFWATSNPVRPALPSSCLVRVGGAFVAIVALATALSPYRLTAAIGIYHRYGGLLSILLFFTAMVLTLGLYWRRPRELEDLCKAAGAASLLVSGYFLIQAAGLDWHSWRVGGFPARWHPGILGNPNFTGGYLGATLPFTLFIFARSRHLRDRAFALVSAPANLAALWLTGSRGGILAAAAGAALFLALYTAEKIPRRIKRLGLLLALLVPVAGLLISRAYGTPQVAGVSLSPSNLLIRLDYWKSAAKVISDHPVLGTGPDTFYANYARYSSPDVRLNPTSEMTDNPHNIFLAHAVGSGLLGAGLYVALIGLTFSYGVRRLRRSREHRLLLATFLAVLGGYVVQGFFSIDVPALALLGWLCVGAVAALADPAVERARKPPPPATPDPLSHTRAAGCITAGAALLVLAIGLRPFVADVKARSGLEAYRTSRETEGLLLLKQASRLNPAEADYHFVTAYVFESLARKSPDGPKRRSLLTRAVSEVKRALQLRPDQVIYLSTLDRLSASLERPSAQQPPDPNQRPMPRRTGWKPAVGVGLSAGTFALLGIWLYRRTAGNSSAGSAARKRLIRLELLAGSGILAMAVSTPYLGPLYGLRAYPGEFLEIASHLAIGLATALTGGWMACRTYQPGCRSPTQEGLAVAVLFGLTAVALLVHLPRLAQIRTAGEAAQALLHIGPALASLALLAHPPLAGLFRRNSRLQSAIAKVG